MGGVIETIPPEASNHSGGRIVSGRVDVGCRFALDRPTKQRQSPIGHSLMPLVSLRNLSCAIFGWSQPW